ncbi:uncharacterized protein LOC114352075 isoform X2 [Ostrinia furnacalis]|uniref:uncharacterized protein LOC114352075 isoform X2 n=1 Tax=Ostrinia furnacalis TaxID=93504 RepID=UPI00103AF896|nr:uncharacterized protein LOC114352075 isoform X2 [Ostrinia furnacalis]
MLKTTIVLLIICREILGLTSKNEDDVSEFGPTKHLNSLLLKPAIRYFDKSEINEISNDYVYKVSSPSDIDEAENNNENFMIKAKPKPIDIGPYNLIQRLDEMKYMVLWLNLYCGMHPDCDKKKLNEELQRMVSSVGIQNS